jgi:GAF domain-containing protein
MSYPIPKNEHRRLAALASLQLQVSPKEDEYTALVELIAAITGCPISMVSIVEKDHQWFKAKKGTHLCATSRNEAFCSYTIVQDDVLVVEDALQDERFCQLQLVTGARAIRFYAGVPIKSPDGDAIGTVCVLDTKPRRLSVAKRKALQVVANQVAELLWLRRQQQQTQASVSQIEANHNAELSRIGYELHEDFAQSIAACMKFMEIGKTSTDLTAATLDQTQKVLQDVLNKMRNLSVEINPSHFAVFEA